MEEVYSKVTRKNVEPLPHHKCSTATFYIYNKLLFLAFFFTEIAEATHQITSNN